MPVFICMTTGGEIQLKNLSGGQADLTISISLKKLYINHMEWKTSTSLVPYEEALAFMDKRVEDILAGTQDELVWLLEHPPLYTAGTSARGQDLLDARFPVYTTGRGGQYTYHGPGQRIAYVMLDLNRRGRDLRLHVQHLEAWMIATLQHFRIHGAVRQGRVGVWVQDNQNREAKIAAIGVRVRKWVTFHGVSLNVHPDLSHYAGIVPCGISEFGITSLAALGIPASLHETDALMRNLFDPVFSTH